MDAHDLHNQNTSYTRHHAALCRAMHSQIVAADGLLPVDTMLGWDCVVPDEDWTGDEGVMELPVRCSQITQGTFSAAARVSDGVSGGSGVEQEVRGGLGEGAVGARGPAVEGAGEGRMEKGQAEEDGDHEGKSGGGDGGHGSSSDRLKQQGAYGGSETASGGIKGASKDGKC